MFVVDRHSQEIVFFGDASNEDDARLRFDLSYEMRGKTIVPFTYCNLHGLWEGPEVIVGEVAPSSADTMMEQRIGL